MKKILIVEDERHIGIGLKYNFEAEGFDVSLVFDGPAALQLIEGNPDAFDLVVLDLMLPDMSGYTVLERMRAANVQVPVLILTARTLSEDKIRGFDAGADQYMTKPFELPELLSRARNLLSRYAHRKGAVAASHAASPDETFEFDGAFVNFTRHEVTVRGQPQTLTLLEMKLLKCFAENEGAVLTRSELLDKVWGLDSSPTTRTVDNFIARLRQHFEADPANPRHFLSVRGVGYRFVIKPASGPEVEPAELNPNAEAS